MPPIPVNGPIAGSTPRIEREIDGVFIESPGDRASIEIGIVRCQTGLAIGGSYKKGPAGVGSSIPKCTIIFWSPTGPEFVKSRQVIRRVGIGISGNPGHEQDHLFVLVYHGTNGTRD